MTDEVRANKTVAKRERRQMRDRRGLIDLLSAEIDKQRDSFASRSGSMNTRLSVLIAAASLVSGMQISAHQPHFWYLVGTCFAASAALSGVIALWPRTGGENGVANLQDELWNLGPDMAAYVLMHRKLEVLRADEKTLHWRKIFATVGFLLLAFSIVAVALQVIGVP